MGDNFWGDHLVLQLLQKSLKIMIHTSYTIGITTGEFLSLQTVMVDQKEWIENAIQNRARIATLEITNKYTQYKIDKGEAITAVGSTAIIQAAISEGVVGIAT